MLNLQMLICEVAILNRVHFSLGPLANLSSVFSDQSDHSDIAESPQIDLPRSDSFGLKAIALFVKSTFLNCLVA